MPEILLPWACGLCDRDFSIYGISGKTEVYNRSIENSQSFICYCNYYFAAIFSFFTGARFVTICKPVYIIKLHCRYVGFSICYSAEKDLEYVNLLYLIFF